MSDNQQEKFPRPAFESTDSSQDSADADAPLSLHAESPRQLVLVKHGHRYVFRYERGEESKVLSGLADLARDPNSDLDWFDAAVLSHQLGERMSQKLAQMRNPSMPEPPTAA